MKKIVIAGGDKRMSCLAELLFNSGYSFEIGRAHV